MTKNAFVIIHFGNNIKYFELELYFLKNLKLYTSNDIIYMYSITDTPDNFVSEISKITKHVIGYDDSNTTYNAVAPSHYTQFSTIRTCNFIYAYTLTQYDKICIVESDLIITKNIDEIFLLKTPSISYFFNNGEKPVYNPKMLLNNSVYNDPKMILKNCNTYSVINGGVVVDKPSIHTFNKYTKNLQIIIEHKCKYPNESLFSYTNPNFYNLPVKYNLLHFNLTPQKIKLMNLNIDDVCIVHFNETAYKHLDIIKDGWEKNMNDTERNKNKRIFIMDFKKNVYDVYNNEINNILNATSNVNKPPVTETDKIVKVNLPARIKQGDVVFGVFHMTVINTYERALKIASPYIDNLKYSAQYPFKNDNNTNLPDEIKNKKWGMTLPALKNTLKYLFEKLHYSCYMLCIMNNNFVIYKLEMTDASPSFEKAIKEDHLPMLKDNPLITDYQKDFIRKELNDPVRILQCILKKTYKAYGKVEDKTSEYHAYPEILEGMELPDGVFILNLTDAVILKKDGTEPFPMVTGNGSLGKYNFDEYIPIMSMSGQVGYSDIPIPNYDDVSIFIDDNKLLEFNTFNTNWDKKKINKAVFRGGPSGCGYTPETNMRIKLALMNLKYVDVELSGKGKSIDSRSIKFDPVNGLGMLNTGIKPATSFLTMKEQSNYKYIIHIDGNVNAYRLLTTMRTGSLIIRVSSQYRSWFDHLIKPDVHYVMVKPDLSDLESAIEWCMKNDKKCKQIAQNGLNFAISVLKKEFIQSYVQKMLWSLSDYHSVSSPDFAPPGWVKSSPIKQKLIPVSPNYPPPGRIEPESPNYPPPGWVEPASPNYPPPSSSDKSLKRLESSSQKSSSRASSDKSLKRLKSISQKSSSRASSDKSLKRLKSSIPKSTPPSSSDKPLERLELPSPESIPVNLEYIELKGKQCPRGYKGVTHNNKKMCKKNTTLKSKIQKSPTLKEKVPRIKKPTIRKEKVPKIKICDDDKELNPKNRCVKKCRDNYTRRIEDFKCVRTKCDDDKELNPNNKCVKKCKDNYTRRIEDFKCIKNKIIKSKTRKEKVPKIKICDDDKELNPKNRCVKKCKDNYTRRIEDFKCIKNKVK
jgi:hypothetical protein